MSDQIYDYDEFFIPAKDPGVEIQVPIHGRSVPIKVRRGLTLGDVKGAQSKAVIQKKNLKGEIEIAGVDEEVFTTELLFNAIVSWPFKKNLGTKEDPDWRDVPVTKENVRAILADGAAYIQNFLVGKMQEAKQSVIPLESPSGEDF
jgi:hypothetical protein